MTVRQLLDEAGYTHSGKDRSIIGHRAKKATLNAGKRTYDYEPEGNYFVVIYDDEYLDLIRQLISDFFIEKSERASKEEARQKECAEIREAKKAKHLTIQKIIKDHSDATKQITSENKAKRPRIQK